MGWSACPGAAATGQRLRKVRSGGVHWLYQETRETLMETPAFRMISTDKGNGVTYVCGCDCTPTAVPAAAAPGMEHCCCGKVHFAGPGAADALSAYLEDRAAKRKREPQYDRGAAVVTLEGSPIEVAWAFPREDA